MRSVQGGRGGAAAAPTWCTLCILRAESRLLPTCDCLSRALSLQAAIQVQEAAATPGARPFPYKPCGLRLKFSLLHG